tara:strand:+ start:6198 stop:6512 length:315 start_codon:yes stop_codon:yes gene_type:complete
MTIYIVFSFYPKIKKANKIAKDVVKKKLAACVNINKNINSFFIWEKKFCNEKEIELSFKTTSYKVKSLISYIESNHPYECPAIFALPINKTNIKFSNWVKKQTS